MKYSDFTDEKNNGNSFLESFSNKFFNDSTIEPMDNFIGLSKKVQKCFSSGRLDCYEKDSNYKKLVSRTIPYIKKNYKNTVNRIKKDSKLNIDDFTYKDINTFCQELQDPSKKVRGAIKEYANNLCNTLPDLDNKLNSLSSDNVKSINKLLNQKSFLDKNTIEIIKFKNLLKKFNNPNLEVDVLKMDSYNLHIEEYLKTYYYFFTIILMSIFIYNKIKN